MQRAILWGLAGLALASCGAQPAPEFFGALRRETTIDGYRFVVFQRGERAEVIRMGYLTRTERAGVPARMILAVEQTTGCQVTEPGRGRWRSPALVGDTGEARFTLRCAYDADTPDLGPVVSPPPAAGAPPPRTGRRGISR